MKALILSFTGLLVLGLFLSIAITANAKSIEGLVVYFDFSEGKGDTATDGSGKGNDGTLKGGTKWEAGKYGGGLAFDGVDGVVEVKDSDSLQFTDGLTLAAWIKPALKGNDWQLIASKGADAGEFFELLLNPQGILWLGWMFQAGRVVPAQSPPSIQPDVWQHVAVAWDPKKFWNIYLDGKLLVEYPKQDDKLVPNGDPLLIGTEKGMPRFYNGAMDDWALFSRGLTIDEIDQIMGGIKSMLPVNETKAKLTSTWGNIKR
jgi:hypothetical protein